MLYAEHTRRQLPENLYQGTTQAKQPALDRSAPGRYAPGDATIGPIYGVGKRREKQHTNKPQRCLPKPDNLINQCLLAVALIGLGFALVGCEGEGEADSVVGTWAAETAVGGKATLTFNADGTFDAVDMYGTRLSGTYTQSGSSISGRSPGTARTGEITVEGTVRGDTMSGTFTYERVGSSTFTAHRA